MQLIFRPATLEDFEDFYHSVALPCQCNASEHLHIEQEWRLFRNNPHALSIVVEDLDRNTTERFVGYTEGIFISSGCTQWIKTGIAPYVNLQIANNTPCNRCPLLSYEEIRIANSGEGLNLLINYSGWRDQILTPHEAYLVRTFLDDALTRVCAGYKFKEILIEVRGDGSLQRCLNAGFRLRTDYRSYFDLAPKPPPHSQPYLLSITQEEAEQDDGSLLSRLFAYKEPRFYFKDRDQQLLSHALDGKSDEEIALLLSRTVANIKKRWLAIYERVGEILPNLLPSGSDLKRGPEKRRILLAYIRDHPEELRPLNEPDQALSSTPRKCT